MFGYENELVCPIFISKQTFEDSLDLLLLIKNDNSYYVYIKDFNTFMFHKAKKKCFCKSCLQCFSSKNVLIKHKEDCLSINRMQSAEIEEGIIKFENYCKKKYHDHIPCSYAFKVVCIDNRFSKLIVVYIDKNVAYEFIKAIFKEYRYCKNIIKNISTKM